MRSGARRLGWAGAVAGVCALLWSGCGGLTGGSSGVGHAVMPEADLVVSVDMVGLRSAPIYPEMEATFGGEEGNPLLGVTTQVRELASAAGLTESDEAEILFAADLKELDTDQPQEIDLDEVNAVGAIALLSPMSPAGLREVILSSEPGAAGQLAVTERQEAGYPVTVVTVEEGGVARSLHVAHAEGDRLLFVGSKAGVGGAVARHSGGGAPPKLKGELGAARAALPEGAQVRAMFVLPDGLREELRAKAAEAGENPNDPSALMMIPTLEALTGLKTVSLGVVAGEAMDVALVGRLESAEQATKLRAMLDSFKGLLQMMLMAGTGGEAAGLLETLTIETLESDLTISVQLTEADLKMLRQMGEQQAQGAYPPGS